MKYPKKALMHPDQRIRAFVLLGERLRNISEKNTPDDFYRASEQNGWFTLPNIHQAIHALGNMLSESKLRKWLTPYGLIEQSNELEIGIIMAGNIPLVGFHDLLCVLMAGHRASIKLSSSDQVLPKWMVRELIDIEPVFSELISFPEYLKGVDALIATGSDNSSRYFEYYFRNIPKIIRHNRTSIAVLDGSEDKETLIKLGHDIFDYFGLGCRNVSMLLLKNGYDLVHLLDILEVYHDLRRHNKYFNNYEYQKAILLVNKEPHLDNGFLLLKESTALHSPIATLFYQYINTNEEAENYIRLHREKIQCVVSSSSDIPGKILPGEAQKPELWDYADGIDTLKFLLTEVYHPVSTLKQDNA